MYRGKHHDGFSYAINTIFIKNGYSRIKDPDCLSQRQAALVLCSEKEKWFCSAINWKEYMYILLKNLGINQGFILEEANIELLNLIPEEIPFVIGEVSIPEWDLTITDKLCGTDSAFLICKRRNESYLVSNPLGCISMMCSAEYIESLLNNKDAFIFYLTQQFPVSLAPVTTLISEAVALTNRFNLISEMQDIFLPNSVRKRAALQYGIIGYLQSRAKLTDFFSLDYSVTQAIQRINILNMETIFPQLLEAESCFLKALNSAMQRCENNE